ncbi:MAG: hypothetical protein WC465_04135 [Patescibacteria group bacterium]
MKPPKFFIIIIILLVLLFAGVIVARLFSPEDTWLCQDGQWVKHGNPSAVMPTTPCYE